LRMEAHFLCADVFRAIRRFTSLSEHISFPLVGCHNLYAAKSNIGAG